MPLQVLVLVAQIFLDHPYSVLRQVLVLVHQVFLDLMTHSFFQLSSAALLIMDECHHAQVRLNQFESV